MSVYYYQNNEWGHYFVEKEGSKLMELPYEERIVNEADGKSYLMKTTKHQGVLLYTLSDAPAMISKINLMAAPDHSNLIRLAKDYHEMVCKDQSCVVYEKKRPVLDVRPEVLGGVIQYKNDEITEQRYAIGGIILHIGIPRASERLFFRSGATFAYLLTTRANLMSYKVPFQLKYLYPKGKVNPCFAYGLNFYVPNFEKFFSSISFYAGVKIQLFRFVYLSLGTDFEFVEKQPYLIIPERALSYSFLTGLYFNFGH